MFSYEVTLRRIKSQSKMRGIASVTIDGIMTIDGFKVIEGSNGYFVSVPNHKGTIMEDGVKVEKYFDDIRFPGEEGLAFSQELKTAILNEYNNGGGSSESPSRGSAAAAHAKKAAPKKQDEDSSSEKEESSEKPSTPNRSRKPIWDFS